MSEQPEARTCHPERSEGSAVHVGPITFIVLGIALCALGCARKRTDPVDTLKAMIPQIEAALNRRSITALQRLGTPRFSANRLLIDVFADAAGDTADLRIKHLSLTLGEAELILAVALASDSSSPARELTLHLVGQREWRIDTFAVGPAPPTDPGDSLGNRR
ncbi:MAG: hypothetical protein AB1792_01280 [Candidatus Zixiibacteriota bacterium]